MKMLLGVMVLAVILSPPAAGAAPGGRVRVGVVDFYAPTPLATFEGVFPARFATDDLSTLLAGAAGDRLVMIPRETVLRSEQTLRWRGRPPLRSPARAGRRRRCRPAGRRMDPGALGRRGRRQRSPSARRRRRRVPRRGRDARAPSLRCPPRATGL